VVRIDEVVRIDDDVERLMDTYLKTVVSLIEPSHLKDLDHVKFIEEIGRGTYGVVHKAVWRGSVVAAKVLCTPTIAHEEDIINHLDELFFKK
jgi:hypothetical protein